MLRRSEPFGPSGATVDPLGETDVSGEVGRGVDTGSNDVGLARDGADSGVLGWRGDGQGWPSR